MVRLTKKKIKKAIEGTGGIIQVIANKCGVTRTWMSLTLHKKGNEDLWGLVIEEREKLKDLAESSLINRIKEKDFPAIKWYLTTQAKDRGYGDKQEIEHFGQSNIKIEFGEPTEPKKEDQK